MKGFEHPNVPQSQTNICCAPGGSNQAGAFFGYPSHNMHSEDYQEICLASEIRGSSNHSFSKEWSAPADHLTRALRILVRPAMIANAESLYARKVAVEISDDTQCNSNDCNMWLYSPTAMASGLLVFGILPTGEITWTARVHLRGKPASSRAGELSGPDAAGEIFTICRDFVKAFTAAVRI